MIRQDSGRPGVYVVDVSDVLVAELAADWSRPVQMKIEDGELVMRTLESFELSGSVEEVELVGTVYRIPSSRGDEATR